LTDLKKELRMMTREVAVHEATMYHIFDMTSAREIKKWVCKRLGHPKDTRDDRKSTCFCGEKRRMG
jgi:hypothetical protein